MCLFSLKQRSVEIFTPCSAQVFLWLFDADCFIAKQDAGIGCNVLKSCLQVGVLEPRNLTQSFVHNLLLPEKEAKNGCLFFTKSARSLCQSTESFYR